MPPKLIIFDWDGTLADTTAPIIATMQAAFEEHGLDSPAADEIRPFIGYSLARIVESLAPNLGEETREKIMRTFMRICVTGHIVVMLFIEICVFSSCQHLMWIALV